MKCIRIFLSKLLQIQTGMLMFVFCLNSGSKHVGWAKVSFDGNRLHTGETRPTRKDTQDDAESYGLSGNCNHRSVGTGKKKVQLRAVLLRRKCKM